MGSSTPTTTTQNVVQQQNLPSWYVDYLQNVMGRAVTQADSSQPPPPIQQIAGLTPDQLAAYQQVRSSQGAATPYYNAANQNFGAAAQNFSGIPGIDFTGQAYAGHQDLRAGEGLTQQAGTTDTAATALPYAQQGTGYLQGAAQGSALSAANPYLAASAQPTGLEAATPYLRAAAAPSYSNVSSYLNPYNQAVTDQIAALGARNLTENILPGVSDTFIKAGQYGSQQQGTVGERAIRDTNAAILNAQTQALQQGYGQALSASQADAARMAGLGQTAGGLGTAQQQALLGAGQATGQLSAQDLARLQASGVDISQIGLGLAGAQATDAARALAAGQGLSQTGLGIGQLGLGAAQAQSNALLGAGQGLLGAGTAQQNLGTTGQDQTLRGAAALEATGAAQQGQGQANLNSLFNQQTQQYNLPWDTIAKLSGVIQGLPVGGTTSGQAQTTTPGPSVAGQIGGIGLGVAGLANSGIFKRDGGPVKKPRRTHSYGNLPKRGLALAAA